MIRVKVTYREDCICSLEVTGHAGYAEHGSDIVCAAVSVLVTTTINGIERLAGFTPLTEVDDVEGGYLYTEMPSDCLKEQTSQLLLQNLVDGLNDVRQEYPDYLSLKEITL